METHTGLAKKCLSHVLWIVGWKVAPPLRVCAASDSRTPFQFFMPSLYLTQAGNQAFLFFTRDTVEGAVHARFRAAVRLRRPADARGVEALGAGQRHFQQRGGRTLSRHHDLLEEFCNDGVRAERDTG